jgi:hypothetical protein
VARDLSRISWYLSEGAAGQLRCLRIKNACQLRYSSDFADHPLAAQELSGMQIEYHQRVTVSNFLDMV